MLQGPNKDFALHTIGWQAFQDLATTIIEVDFGRIVTRVAKTKDQGRDGFFYGVPDEVTSAEDRRETTIQSKHFAAATTKLTAGSLTTELESVRALVSSGRADGYVLITNASLTEGNRLEIVAALRDAGVAKPLVFGREWVVDKILEHPKIRALAPRVYGLGDLSWIESEKARKQALAILETMAEGLRCYVPTEAHRQAVRALERHHFVLLLGDPAVGKSSIAAALSVAATDEQACDVIFVRNPAEFLRSWDPEIENRLFWIDDAFGATKLESALMDPWNKAFSAMQAAMQRGNRFILTSRSHIWRQAQRELKQGAFPPLLHGHVVVDVEKLSLAEQQRILYNHLRFGAQPSAFKLRIRGFLDDLLAAGHFRPEIARRLADSAYTKALVPTPDGLKDFFARPEAFLRDTLTNLPDPMRAAIGLIFINGGRLASPIEGDEAQRLIEELYGVTAAELRMALQTLSGSFVLSVQDGEHRYWTYKHPTIGDAFARLVGQDQELVTLYVRGAKLSQLLDEAVCGVNGPTGSIVIPPSLYATLIGRFPKSGLTNDVVRQFLVRRSGVGFLKAFLERYPKMVTQPTVVSRPIARDMSALLIIKAGNHGLLPLEEREKLMQQLREHAEDYADVSFLLDEPGFEKFLTDAERNELIGLARNDLDRRLDEIIDSERDGYERSWEPSDWFDEIRSLIDDHRALFPNDAQVATSVERALKRIDRAVERLEEDRDPEPEWESGRSSVGGSAVLSAKGRSTFDDLV
jgi:energy-coupling factor transporter ATP-binding protein EcfA2